jgi:hypothetical protein
MPWWAWVLLGWVLGSIPLSVLAGKFLKHREDGEPPADPMS